LLPEEAESEADSEIAHALMGVARDAPLDNASEYASLLATAHRCARVRDKRAARFQQWVTQLAFRRRCPPCDYFDRSAESMALEIFARISDREWFQKVLASINATTTQAIVARAMAASQADAPAQPGQPATLPSPEAAAATADSGDGATAEEDLGQMMLEEVALYKGAFDRVQAIFECLNAQACCTPLAPFHEWRHTTPAPIPHCLVPCRGAWTWSLFKPHRPA
jgi:hypothetical protein